MPERILNLNQRIALRVRELRVSHQLSLDALANKSGVSRSMISLIERGESSPTAVVLEKLAAGLGVTLASLFDVSAQDGKKSSGPVSRREDQPEWKDPASGYVRRNISPHGVPQPMQIVEVQFPPGERVAFETGVSASGQNRPGVSERKAAAEVDVALSVTGVAQGRDEHTQREPATFDYYFGGWRVVGPADRP